MMNKRNLLIGLSAIGIAVALLYLKTKGSSPSPTEKPPSNTAYNQAQDTRLTDGLVQVANVEVQDINDVVTINGKIALNTLKVQQISSRIPGRVDRIFMVEGASVRAGEPLAWIYSPEIGRAHV